MCPVVLKKAYVSTGNPRGRENCRNIGHWGSSVSCGSISYIKSNIFSIPTENMVAPFLQLCLCAAGLKEGSGFAPSELCLCFLQTMWFCWFPETMTFHTHWGGLQPRVKRPGWESATPSLRTWFFSLKQQIAPSKLRVCCCPKARCLDIWVLLTSDGTTKLEMDRHTAVASEVMQALYHTVVGKRRLAWKAKLSFYYSTYTPIYGHEL